MFRMWGKIWKENHLVRDDVFEEDSKDTRTHKIFRGLEHFCYTFDLGKPIWLDSNIRQFKAHNKVRFYQDSFVEEIPFDFMELQIMEEDEIF